MQVTELTDSGLIKFWEGLLPPSDAEKPWLMYQSGGKLIPSSPRELVAQAHCIAAYLNDHGLAEGDSVLIISRPSPFYFMVDLALQFLGAVNVSLPDNIDRPELESIVKTRGIRFAFIEDLQVFRNLNELNYVRTQLNEIILASDEVDDLDPDKLVTFDRVIPLGKELWRENHDLMKQRKSSVPLSAPYAWLYDPVQPRIMDFRTYRMEVEKAVALIKEAKPLLTLSWLSPHRLMQRTYGFYAHMRCGNTLMCLGDTEPLAAALARIKPSAISLTTGHLEELFTEIRKSHEARGSAGKKFERMMKVLERRDVAILAGNKPPIMVRIRFSFLNRGLLNGIRKQLGGKLHTFLLDSGELHIHADRLFRNMGYRITRP